MRRPEREHQGEGLARFRLALEEGAGVVGLRDGIVAGPVSRRRVVAFVVERVVVLVRALAGLPVRKTITLLRRDVS